MHKHVAITKFEPRHNVVCDMLIGRPAEDLGLPVYLAKQRRAVVRLSNQTTLLSARMTTKARRLKVLSRTTKANPDPHG